jgi:glycosyltransferase involved in cell wall biosynthesis
MAVASKSEVAVKVSVIIPVFNAEKYLKECLDSVLSQTLQEIEVIIINDGSTDGSKSIINDYCKQDSRIIFIENSNGGVSKARNAGLAVAKGEFVGFLDADDYIEENMYEVLYSSAISNNGELIVCDAFTQKINEKPATRLKLKNETVDVTNFRGEIVLDLLKFKYDYSNWNKLYSNKIIKQNNLKFNEKMTIWEDLLFNLMYLNYIPAIITLDKCLYHYRVHPASIMGQKREAISEQYNLLFANYIQFCQQNNLYKEEAIFREERGETCINNILYFFEPPMNRLTLWNQSVYFRRELYRLNPAIYSFNRSVIYSFVYKNALSRFIWLNTFPFFHLSFRYLKKIIKQLPLPRFNQ